MLVWILAALALYVTQTVLPTLIRYFFSGTALGPNLLDALGGRDNPPTMPMLGARASRALNNMQEALFVFLPLSILVHVQGADPIAWWGGAWFVAFRALYIPAYLTAIPGVRSTVWALSWLGLLAIGWTAIQPLLGL